MRHAHDLIGHAQNPAHVVAFKILQLHLEAAAIADAGHRRRRNGDDERLAQALQAAVKLSDDRARRCDGFFSRSLKSAKVVNSTPWFEALVKVAPEKPEKATAFVTPGTESAISEACLITASVRSSEALSGSCTTTIA